MAQTDSLSQVEDWLEEGLTLHRAGDLVGAERLFRRAADARRDDPTALYLLGLNRFEAGDADAAVALMEQVSQLRPTHVQALLTLASLRRWRDEPAMAEAVFGKVLALEPKNEAALAGRCEALLAMGKLQAAIEAGHRAVDLAPLGPSAYLALAQALAATSDTAGAIQAYRAVVRLAPANAAAWTGLSLQLLQQAEAVEALAAAERATLLAPASPEAWFALGTVQSSVSRHAAAADALERSVALAFCRPATHAALGAAYVALEQAALAEQHLLASLELEPANPAAHANLSSLYLLTGELAHARDHATAALELDPSLAVAHRNLAGILAREGRAIEARRHRELAYRGANLVVTSAARPERRVLLLSTTESGNVPDRFLIPADRYTRATWYIEYAEAAQMQALPPYDVVFNAIGDADLAGPTETNVARFLAVCDRPFLNHPDKVRQTRRDRLPDLLRGIEGLVVPSTMRVPAGHAADMAPPLLLRPVGAHGGEGVTLAMSRAAERPAGDHYATQFCDYRSPDGLYRKFRMIFIDREPYPYHQAIGADWMVHYGTSGTADVSDRIAEERRFLEDPDGVLGPLASAAIRALGKRLDLDYAGCDFTLLADGRALLFEANATMLVHPEDPAGPLAHKNAQVGRILSAFQAMLAL